MIRLSLRKMPAGSAFSCCWLVLCFLWPCAAAHAQSEQGRFVSKQSATDSESGRNSSYGLESLPEPYGYSSNTIAPVDSDYLLQGIALPWLDAQLLPNSPGRVVAILAREGQRINEGDPIVRLEDGEARAAAEVARIAAEAKAAVQQAELEMRAAQSLYIRTDTAFRAQASSQFELDAKRNQYETSIAAYERQVELSRQARAEYQLAQTNLAAKTLEAPFSGTIVNIPARVGNTLGPDDAAAHVVNLDKLRVEMHLPVSLFGKIRKDQVLELYATAPLNRGVDARVRYVSPMIEPTSATFRVSFVIENLNHELPAGFEVKYRP